MDNAIPWGIYMPPSNGPDTHNMLTHNEEGEDGDALTNEHCHAGYVRIVDAKGKHFQCGFSRPIGSLMEAAAGKKRSRSQIADQNTSTTERSESRGNACDGVGDTPITQHETDATQQKITLTEERLHPEEAFFLHMRGLLRIESNSKLGSTKTESTATKIDSINMSTQDLFCKMLPECEIPLAAYLAYAHLRAQGFILIRYTEQRMSLLCRMTKGKKKHDDENQSTKSEDEVNIDSLDSAVTVPEVRNMVDPNPSRKRKQINDEFEPAYDKTENGDVSVSKASSISRTKTRPLRLKLSDDVASAPPPCIVSLEADETTGQPNIRLAYYAYKPNARFRRSNPGLPNFGVAVMPFHSDNSYGPSFDTLNSLVSMCEGGEHVEPKEDSSNQDSNVARSGIPLRVVTVADGGAVIVFGVTNGDVPSINQTNMNSECSYSRG
ncbi:hypothetical protein ACHAXR_010343 [Thalassiosira sp. AJA248-18]